MTEPKENKLYNFEKAQEESAELQKKIGEGEAKDYHEAEILVEKENYIRLLDAYEKKFRKVKFLESRARGVFDEETRNIIQVAETERHNVHIELEAVGKRIGKNKDAIMIDILRKDGNLEEYDLPEFILLSSDDLNEYGNVDTKVELVNGRLVTKISNDNLKTLSEADSTDVATKTKSVEELSSKEEGLDPDETMLVYTVTTYPMGTYSGGIQRSQIDFTLRKERQKLLAKDLGAREVYLIDVPFHENYLSLSGVAVKKDQLEKVASIIREHPYKYRLGKQFYIDEEQNRSEDDYLRDIKKIISSYFEDSFWLDEYSEKYINDLKEEYPQFKKMGKSELLIQVYLETIRAALGDEAYALASKAYKDLLGERLKKEKDEVNKILEKVKPKGTFNPVIKNIEALLKEPKKKK